MGETAHGIISANQLSGDILSGLLYYKHIINFKISILSEFASTNCILGTDRNLTGKLKGTVVRVIGGDTRIQETRPQPTCKLTNFDRVSFD
jgi:hypothetical protein